MFLRKIEDIRISNKRISVTREANISVAEIERQIEQIDYQPATGEKGDRSENVKVPPFIQVFYYLFFANLKIPTEGIFWSTYLKWVGGDDEKGEIIIEGKSYEAAGLKKRLNRTYPSLIRDLHFLYLLDSSQKFEYVDYSMLRDYYNGLDLKVTYNNKEAFISLFIDTSRARYFKEKKTRRHDYSMIHEIELNVAFRSLSKLGSIYVLNEQHIELLENLLNETK